MSRRVRQGVYGAAVPMFAALFMMFTTQNLPAQSVAEQDAGSAKAAAAAVSAFDIVSIKPNKSSSGGMSINTSGDSFTATNCSLMLLLQNAYSLRDDQILGAPGWVTSTKFDIKAKIVDPNSEPQKKLTRKQEQYQYESRLQSLLVEYFHVKAHKEIKESPVYELVFAKGGSKLKADAFDESKNKMPSKTNELAPGTMLMNAGHLQGMAIELSSLTGTLAYEVQRNIIDKTGLTGTFDIDLKWTADNGAAADPDSSAPSLFTALQEQLGLKLQSAKGPVEVLVLDHIEMPAEN
jgi:uncharacterized protein (TIGR03435 family)